MSTSSPKPTVHRTDLFGADTGSSPSISNDLQPRAISEQTFVIVTSALATALILAIFIGSLHLVRRRRRRQENEKRQQQDIEQSLQRARRPVLTIDTDLPHAKDFPRSTGRAILSDPPIYSEAPPAPLAQVRTALPTIYGSGKSMLGPMRAHSAIRNPLGSHPPSVAGRTTMRPVYQDSSFEVLDSRGFIPTHNRHDMGAVYDM